MKKLIRKNQELSAILHISRVLTSSFDLEKNLNSVMKTLAGQLEMQRGCVFLLSQYSEELRIVAAYGLSQEEIKRGKYRIGEGIVGQVIKNGRSMFIPNIGIEPKFMNRTASRPCKSGISFLCVPIEIDGQIMGVISVDRIYTAEHGDVDDDLRVLNIIASLIAQFVKLWQHFRRAEQECGHLRSQLREKFNLHNIIGESPAFQQVLKTVLKVASTDTTVLLLGESGTGKELIAQFLHYQSPRSMEPFIAVNMAALPENLIEAELFGVDKGAFTGATSQRAGRFEMANNGTIFLDEIGELPLNLQVKLLRVLQERKIERIGSSSSLPINIRVIAATNRNLQEEVVKGNFRSDLYWRLNVIPVDLPPLRNRTEDIPLLLNFYLDKFNRTYNRNVLIDPFAIQKLQSYKWPGNIRELTNMVERLVIMADKDVITINDLEFNLSQNIHQSVPVVNIPQMTNSELGNEIEHLEHNRILQALKENNCIQQRASKSLGLTPRQLGYRIKKYGINLKNI